MKKLLFIGFASFSFVSFGQQEVSNEQEIQSIFKNQENLKEIPKETKAVKEQLNPIQSKTVEKTNRELHAIRIEEEREQAIKQ